MGHYAGEMGAGLSAYEHNEIDFRRENGFKPKYMVEFDFCFHAPCGQVVGDARKHLQYCPAVKQTPIEREN